MCVGVASFKDLFIEHTCLQSAHHPSSFAHQPLIIRSACTKSTSVQPVLTRQLFYHCFGHTSGPNVIAGISPSVSIVFVFSVLQDHQPTCQLTFNLNLPIKLSLPVTILPVSSTLTHHNSLLLLGIKKQTPLSPNCFLCPAFYNRSNGEGAEAPGTHCTCGHLITVTKH